MTDHQITSVAAPSVDTDAANKAYVLSVATSGGLPTVGGTMTGDIDMSARHIYDLGTPSNASDAATKTYVDTKFWNVQTPSNDTDAATKKYVDDNAGGDVVTSDLWTKVNKSGDTITGTLVFADGKNITLDGGYLIGAENYAEYDVIAWQSGGNTLAAHRNGTSIDSGTTGATVNTRVLRAAINNTPLGGNLYIGSGTYVVNADLNCTGETAAIVATSHHWWYVALPVQNDIHIRGSGIGSTILQFAPDQYTTNHPAILMLVYGQVVDDAWTTGPQYASVEGITFDGDRDNQTAHWWDIAGMFATMGDLQGSATYSDLEAINSPGHGFYFACAGSGWLNNSLIDNLRADNCYLPGVVLDGLQDSTARNIWISDSGDYTNNVSFAVMNALDHYHQNCTYENINVNGGQIYMTLPTNSTFAGLHYRDDDATDFNSVVLDDCRDINFVGCTIEKVINAPGAASTYGLTIKSGTDINWVGGRIEANKAITVVDGGTYLTTLDSQVVFSGVEIVSNDWAIADASSVVDAVGCSFVLGDYASAKIALCDTNGQINITGSTSNKAGAYSVGSGTAALRHAGTRNMGLENVGATSVADGGTIAHGIGVTPTAVYVTPSLAGTIASVTAIGSSTFTVDFGGTVTTQTVYWRAVY